MPSASRTLVQTAGKVRPDPGTDQDQTRRIWPVRATTCRQTRQKAPRDDLLSGVHALLHAEPEGQLQDWNAHREISLAAQSHVVAGPAATNPALVGPGTSQHSQRRAEGPLRLLRHCRKLSFPAKGPSGGRTLLAQNAVQPELGRAHNVGHVPPDQTAATDLATKSCTFPIGSYKLSQCCESSSEERSAGNPHATFCGNRGRATASGDPVKSQQWLRYPTNPPAA